MVGSVSPGVGAPLRLGPMEPLRHPIRLNSRSKALSAACLALISAPAEAGDANPNPVPPSQQTREWYLRNEIGGNFIPAIGLADKTFSDGGDTVSWTGASLSTDPGFGWTIAGGWRLTDTLAVEVMSGLSYNTFDSVSGTLTVNGTTGGGTVGVSGSLLQVPAMAGIRLELPVARDFWLNLGGSAGGIYLNGSLNTSFSDGTVTVPLSGSDGSWAFAYSATLGIEWDLTADIGIGVAYRFLGTTSASFGPLDAIEAQGIYNQNALATVTFRF